MLSFHMVKELKLNVHANDFFQTFDSKGAPCETASLIAGPSHGQHHPLHHPHPLGEASTGVHQSGNRPLHSPCVYHECLHASSHTAQLLPYCPLHSYSHRQVNVDLCVVFSIIGMYWYDNYFISKVNKRICLYHKIKAKST